MVDLIEQRGRLRPGEPPADAIVVVRGGRDTIEKLRTHAQRTARAWSLDGAPLYGISVFIAEGRSVTELLRSRFANFRTVHLTTVGRIREHFALLSTGRSPHYTIQLASATDDELARLLLLLGPAQHNEQYGSFE